jgi:hypothetical protein
MASLYLSGFVSSFDLFCGFGFSLLLVWDAWVELLLWRRDGIGPLNTVMIDCLGNACNVARAEMSFFYHHGTATNLLEGKERKGRSEEMKL